MGAAARPRRPWGAGAEAIAAAPAMHVGRWDGVEAAAADPITGLAAALRDDPHQDKVGLCQGAYKDDDGNPFLLPSVAAAEAAMALEPADHEYSAVDGLAEFVRLSQEFVFGTDSSALREGRIASVQALSGTGALRVCAETLMRVSHHSDKCIWLPKPSWGNHAHVFATAGLQVQHYRYLAEDGVSLDFEGMQADLLTLPRGSVVLFHASAHNPTGIDPTMAQWDQLAELCGERQQQLSPIMDTAYQGFASGDPDRDAYSVRAMVDAGCPSLMVCQSFSKNMGLYGERVGCFSALCTDRAEAERLTSQIKQAVLRPLWSFPPLYGYVCTCVYHTR